MPSPFPGMDPYLEEPSSWSDFHMTFLVAIRSALRTRLPERYGAHLDQYVWLEDAEEETERAGKPDVFVTDRGRGKTEASAVATLTAPTTQSLPARLRRGARYMRLIDRKSRRIVTIVEVLSPSNKDTDREAYLTKRREIIATRTNLVEIDLLRSGHRPVPRSTSDYRILISRASEFPSVDVWGFGIRDRIPLVPIPLDPEVPAVPIDLKPCLDYAYDEGSFDRETDYSQPPEPTLRPADAEWANALLSSRTRQGTQP